MSPVWLAGPRDFVSAPFHSASLYPDIHPHAFVVATSVSSHLPIHASFRCLFHCPSLRRKNVLRGPPKHWNMNMCVCVCLSVSVSVCIYTMYICMYVYVLPLPRGSSAPTHPPTAGARSAPLPKTRCHLRSDRRTTIRHLRGSACGKLEWSGWLISNFLV